MRASIANVVMAIVIDGLLGAAFAGDAPTAMAEQALAICQGVERMPAGDTERKLARLADGLRMGEAAVAADDGDARAHLAVCCNLGKQLDLTGFGLRAFGRLRRMQAEVERAAALAPDDPDVLIARGEILRRTPASLGGDRELGRALLRRAVELYPDHVAARLYLARAMADDRAPDARTRVSEAVAAAKRCGAAAEQSEAEELLASLPD